MNISMYVDLSTL